MVEQYFQKSQHRVYCVKTSNVYQLKWDFKNRKLFSKQTNEQKREKVNGLFIICPLSLYNLTKTAVSVVFANSLLLN